MARLIVLLRGVNLAGRNRISMPQLREALLVVFRNFRPRMDRLPLRTDDELASLAMPVQVIVGSADALLRSRETRERIERTGLRQPCGFAQTIPARANLAQPRTRCAVGPRKRFGTHTRRVRGFSRAL